MLDITRIMIKAVEESDVLNTVRTKNKIAKKKGREYAFEFDIILEKRLIEILRSEGYNGRILGEETGLHNGENGRDIIIIDPVDGSHNAKRGIPFYATLLVYLSGNNYEDVVSSVIFEPERNKIYYAEKGKGAYLIANGSTRKLEISDIPEEPVMIDFLKTKMIVRVDILKKFGTLRRFGSIGLATAWIAENIIDATIDTAGGTRALDVLASLFLVKEAGGKVVVDPKEDIVDTRLQFIAGKKQLVNLLAKTFWWRRK